MPKYESADRGALMLTSPRVREVQKLAEARLREWLGASVADALIANRVKRDGEGHAHITVSGPKERKGRRPLTEADLSGLGDFGAVAIGRVEVGDKEAYFVVVDWPAASALRASLGLDPDAQDFHITVGFGPGGDVHGVRKDAATAVCALATSSY